MGGGKCSRSSLDTILVTRDSATGGGCFNGTIQIDENHSDMVKFSSGDNKIHVIASRIAEICDIPPSPGLSQLEVDIFSNEDKSEDKDPSEYRYAMAPPNTDSSFAENLIWDDECTYNFLR